MLLGHERGSSCCVVTHSVKIGVGAAKILGPKSQLLWSFIWRKLPFFVVAWIELVGTWRSTTLLLVAEESVSSVAALRLFISPRPNPPKSRVTISMVIIE